MATYNITTGTGTATITVSTGARGPAGTGGGAPTISATAPLDTTVQWYDPETGITAVWDGSVWVAQTQSSLTGSGINPIDLAGGTALAVNGVYFDSFDALTSPRTLTFTGTPEDGDSIELTFDASSEVFIAFPTSYRVGDTGTTTGVTFPIGNHLIKWSRLDGRWYVADSSWDTGTADTTAPTLTAVSGTATGTTTADLTATTDEGNGTMYWYVGTEVTATPSAAAMQDGTGAAFWTSSPVVSTGVKTASATGIADGQTYQLWVMHRDLAGNNSTIANYQYFTTDGFDVTAPVIVSLSPDDEATDIAIGSNLVATFDEAIFFATGNVTIKNTTLATEVTIPIGDAQISRLGAQLIINPTSSLQNDTNYAIQIEATCISDASGNFFEGILDDFTWNFRTVAVDVTAPTIVSLSPTDNATDVAIASNLVVTFNENIVVGTGNVTIKNLTDVSQVTIAIGDPQCVVSGATLTINPTADLTAGKNYAIQIAATCIDDLAGNSFAGILNDTTWNFATAVTAFTYTSTVFDSSSNLTRTSAPTGSPSNTNKGLISFWAKSSNSSEFYVFHGTSDAIRIAKKSDEGITVILEQAGNVILLNQFTAASVFPLGAWTHVLIGWDLTTGSQDFYIRVNGTDVTPVGWTATDGSVFWNATLWGVASSTGGAVKMNGLLSEFYATNEYLSATSALAAFVDSGSPKDLGADGSTPTGTQPIYYLRNPYSSFETNLGSGGDFTVTGALTDGSTDIP